MIRHLIVFILFDYLILAHKKVRSCIRCIESYRLEHAPVGWQSNAIISLIGCVSKVFCSIISPRFAIVHTSFAMCEEALARGDLTRVRFRFFHAAGSRRRGERFAGRIGVR